MSTALIFLARLRPTLLMLLLALVLAPACKVAEAHTHNLRQLHDGAGSVVVGWLEKSPLMPS